MIETVSQAVRWVSWLSILIPAFIAIWRRRNLNRTQKLLGLLVFIGVLVDCITFYIGSVNKTSNLSIYAFYSIVEFSLLALIFWPYLKKVYPRVLYFGVAVAYLLYFSITSWLAQGNIGYDSIAKVTGAILMIVLVFSLFYEKLTNSSSLNPERQAIFWIGTAVLFYFSANLFVFGINDYAQKSMTLLFAIWGIHGIFNTIHNIFYGIALWLKEGEGFPLEDGA